MILGALERPRQDAPATPMTAAIAAVEKLTEIVMEETRTLRERGHADLEKFTHQKNFGLLEVTRAMRVIPPTGANPFLVKRLKLLRERLDENRKTLALHLKAAEEIANLVSGTLEEAASDGTYTATIHRGRFR